MLTQQQIDKIAIREGIVILNHGEVDAVELGPTRGGGEFVVNAVLRDIDHDRRKGKTKGLRVTDEVNATLKVTTLSIVQDIIARALPHAAIAGTTPFAITGSFNDISSAKYLKNVTCFAKTLDGKYKKITIYNALHDGGLNLAFKPKNESELTLEFSGHWDSTVEDSLDNLYKIEDVDTSA